MKTKDRDIKSFIVIVDSFIDEAHLSADKAKVIKKELKKYISLRFSKKKWIHPEITKFSTDWYREFYRMVDGKDPYEKLKNQSNKAALKLLPKLTISSMREAIAAGIIGNKIDYGASLVVTPDLKKLHKDFISVQSLSFYIDDTALFQKKLSSAKSVLFLADNNGEIVFDTFLLKEIAKNVEIKNIYIMGKEAPMLNDVTVDDLHMLGFERYGSIVSTGSNGFGLHTEDVSDFCKKLLKEADLIVAKGQAYLEFFTEYNFKNVIHILTIKYPVVNAALGTLPTGSNIVLSSTRYARLGKNYFKRKI